MPGAAVTSPRPSPLGRDQHRQLNLRSRPQRQHSQFVVERLISKSSEIKHLCHFGVELGCSGTAGCPCLNIARTHRKPQAATFQNCRLGSSALLPALPAQFLHLGYPNVFAVAVPSPARPGPGSSNKRIDRGKRDLSLFVRRCSTTRPRVSPLRLRSAPLVMRGAAPDSP